MSQESSAYKIENLKKKLIAKENSKWLLLSGSLDPPKTIDVSIRRSRERSGNFLPGVAKDIANMEDALRKNNFYKFNTVKDDRLTKNEAKRKIQELFKACGDQYQPVIYYSGHGQKHTGNWCFSDGALSYEELLNLLPKDYETPLIISDCCFSGQWIKASWGPTIADMGGLDEKTYMGRAPPWGRYPHARLLAACGADEAAIDYADKGGDFTLFVAGKRDVVNKTIHFDVVRLPPGKFKRSLKSFIATDRRSTRGFWMSFFILPDIARFALMFALHKYFDRDDDEEDANDNEQQ